MTQQQKDWIDGATYRQMLERNRFAPVGDPMFTGEAGKYFGEVMARKRKEVGDAAHVVASKSIGW